MSTKAAVAQLVAAQILRTLEDNLVAKKICNVTAVGEIKGKGDSVVFLGLVDPSISSYDPETTNVTYESLKSAGVTLNIDKSMMYAFQVGDIEKLQSGVDLKSSQATRAAYKLQETADTYVLSKYAEAKIQLPEVTALTPANVLTAIGDMQIALSEANVRPNDMWMVLPYWVQTYLREAGVKFQINNGANGTGGMAWTNELGFDVFLSNQVARVGSGESLRFKVMAGSYNSIGYAEQLVENEIIRLESKFADGARGLHVYGAKVIKPSELVVATWGKGSNSLS